MQEHIDPFRIRSADRSILVPALLECRSNTLRAFTEYERALASRQLAVPYAVELNPPLWEVGHVAWFQEFWNKRNSQRRLGIDADPAAARGPSRLAGADALYDSSRVEHTSRWRLPLAGAAAVRDFLARTLDDTLQILGSADASSSDAGTGARRALSPMRQPHYFALLALLHEDMHYEAAQYMANGLAIPLAVGRPGATPTDLAPGSASATPLRNALRAAELAFGPMRFEAGSSDCQFAFDNELPLHRVPIDAFRIDATPVTNGAFAEFVAAGAYAQRRHWSEPGWAWCQQAGARGPRYWRQGASHWQQCWFGDWVDLDEAAPVSNLTFFEAQAWCRWAGRRLPTEYEWERAALERGPQARCAGAGSFCWGEVWEWTSSQFLPYPGFTAHPYRDYSRPWFESRQVLRGASFATHPRMRHPRYRNFFPPERNDIFAGFRSCACE
jgi:ergothioneine biosynthesis protein EgtB